MSEKDKKQESYSSGTSDTLQASITTFTSELIKEFEERISEVDQPDRDE